MKIVVKGIVTREDAASAVNAGADAVYVSNHGGRAEASGRGALESLPEVVDAVCIGRAYIWGLAAFGQAGVEKVLEMLNAELRMVMGQIGATSIEGISARHIGTRRPA